MDGGVELCPEDGVELFRGEGGQDSVVEGGRGVNDGGEGVALGDGAERVLEVVAVGDVARAMET